ncbi:MAG: ISNCY family transposase, partial [Thermoplasmatales archaeon]
WMFFTVMWLSSLIWTLRTNVYLHNTFVMRITQRDYEYFRDSIDYMERYREEFSLPVTTDWKEYEFFYKRMKNMALELRSRVNDA